MPRHKLPPGKKKNDAVQLRLNEAERAAFDRLKEALAAKIPGFEVTDAAALRAVVVAGMAKHGIEWPQVTRATPKGAPQTIARPRRKARP